MNIKQYSGERPRCEDLGPHCLFCFKSGFSTDKEAFLHQTTLDSNGKPICQDLAEWKCRVDFNQAPPWHIYKV